MAYTSQALKDKIGSLPNASPLVSNQFSGFLNITKSKNLHYWYIESERDPVHDSVIFWTNGGPGCSGLLGLFTEMGPWRPLSNGSLIHNPLSWTTMASMVFLEQPVGVGFSYSIDQNEVTNDYQCSVDNLAALKTFFQRFPERRKNKFYLAAESYGGHYIPQWTLAVLNDPDPTLRKSFSGFLLGNPYVNFGSGSVSMANSMWGMQVAPAPLWNSFVGLGCDSFSSSAFSYSGHCWGLMEAIFNGDASLNPYALNFDVCAESSSATTSLADGKATHTSGQRRVRQKAWERLRNHFLSLASKDGKRRNDTASSSSVPLPWERHLSPEDTARTVLQRVLSEWPGGRNSLTRASASDLKHAATQRPRPHAGAVGTREGGRYPGRGWEEAAAQTVAAATRRHHTHSSSSSSSSASAGLTYDPCNEDYTIAYLNQESVQAALHVLPRDWASSLANIPWATCSDPVFSTWPMMDEYADTTALFGDIITHPNKPKDFKMLVYSGDADSVCATMGTQEWIYSVAGAPLLSHPEALWQPWYVSEGPWPGSAQQLGGFLTRFNNTFTFTTVHSAGHEVPAYQPVRAITLLAGFLNGSIFGLDTVSHHPTPSPLPSSVSSNSGNIGHTAAIVVVVLIVACAICAIIAILSHRLRQRKSMMASNEEDDFEAGSTHGTGAGGGGGGVARSSSGALGAMFGMMGRNKGGKGISISLPEPGSVLGSGSQQQNTRDQGGRGTFSKVPLDMSEHFEGTELDKK